jgi:ferredoxin
VTYVIAEPCLGTKNASCVDVCPAACIHTTPEAPQNYIDPDVCIECEQCVLVCPVNAIFLDSELPEEWRRYAAINADFFRANKAGQELTGQQAEHMVDAVQAYAHRAGLAVAAVVLDAGGEVLAARTMRGVAPDADRLADRKAYAALCYELPTHELRAGGAEPRLRRAPVDAERPLPVAGGMPVVAGRDVLGAVGVAGGARTEDDVLCCQAGLAALTVAHR